jgi:hypothetical protein
LLRGVSLLLLVRRSLLGLDLLFVLLLVLGGPFLVLVVAYATCHRRGCAGNDGRPRHSANKAWTPSSHHHDRYPPLRDGANQALFFCC